ncbi:porin [Thalassobius sp. MITS945101]|uniref:porin n=1 Tax=Thalassobius sp. MITS945101 TaxID=3096994 RepID=UPI00399A787A
MKKILFASTALVATAGVASAEISFGGSANFGIADTGSGVIVKNEVDFDIKGSGETDGGIMFGASLDIDGAFSDGADTQGEVSSPEVYMEVGGLKITVGSLDPANDNEGLADVGFDGLGVDDQGEISGNGEADVVINYSFGDIAVAASVEADSAAPVAPDTNDDWALGVSGSFGDVSFAAGYGSVNGTNEHNLHLGYSMGAVALGVQYSDNGTNTGYGLDVKYTQGDLTVTAVYATNDAAGNQDAFGVGASYSLGGGAAIAGGIAEVQGNSVYDLGMTFSF